MSENSVVRMLFTETRREINAISASGLGRYLPAVSPHFFVFLAVAVDISILITLDRNLGSHVFISSLSFGNDFSRHSSLIFLALMFFYAAGLYRVETIGNYRRFLRYFGRAWGWLLATVLVVYTLLLWPLVHINIYLIKMNLEVFALWFGAGGLALIVARRTLAMLFRYGVEQELLVHDAVLVGATELAAQFIARVKADHLGVRVKAVFDDQDRQCSVAGVPVGGNIDDLLAYHKHNEIDTVVIALPLENNESMCRLVHRLRMQPLKVALLPGAMDLSSLRNWNAPFGALPGVHLLPICDFPIDRSGWFIKMLFDKMAAVVALLLFAPVMVCCVIGIKLTSPGPVLFRQRRIGYRNREFHVFKFRSMHVAACDTGELTVRNDPRIFAFGQLMRKLSLDELPQLFNVLLGDMSMVGPRPHMPEATAAGHFYYDSVPSYAARHRMKPGITGWAQVNGWRGPTETLHQIEQRVAHDLYYIENWSFVLDISILIKTAFVGFCGKNAF
ncbi:undecaprenyl-phosphate glucose phosphotransferase [Acidocella aromatica]|uniref:Undecaprenyl-phosphate glucose phosphotransferase n=1 Tax=Acidocella aromatica TaxID=1303579 RepID=A0A840VGL3_9PROT|nr:undecaprenyl-phosphate glucose phosphotransferase [Acidocella aromatica]MBB5374037.1 Undecaprenyl-phosphate glucose phosphotransferase [Acidocella aromatica]